MLVRFITFGENPAVVIARERGLFAARGLEVETTLTRVPERPAGPHPFRVEAQTRL